MTPSRVPTRLQRGAVAVPLVHGRGDGQRLAGGDEGVELHRLRLHQRDLGVGEKSSVTRSSQADGLHHRLHHQHAGHHGEAGEVVVEVLLGPRQRFDAGDALARPHRRDPVDEGKTHGAGDGKVRSRGGAAERPSRTITSPRGAFKAAPGPTRDLPGPRQSQPPPMGAVPLSGVASKESSYRRAVTPPTVTCLARGSIRSGGANGVAGST